MAFKRGNGTVQVELARLQDWAENTDVDLYGEYGKKGIVDEHQEMMMREKTASEQNDQSAKRWTRICALICSIPALLKVAEVLHWIPK